MKYKAKGVNQPETARRKHINFNYYPNAATKILTGTQQNIDSKTGRIIQCKFAEENINEEQQRRIIMRTYIIFLKNIFQSKSFFIFLTLNITIFAQISCVSVNVGGGKSEKAEDLRIVDPIEPFVKKNDSMSDRLWTSKETGNSISYLSECTLKSDPSLESLQNDYISVLKNPEIIQSKIVQYNQREGIRFQSKGTLDGILVKFESLIFKKNNCNYTITYGGREKNFDREKNIFESFLKDFVVP